MAGQPVGEWPDALILLGDQLYADELTPETRRRVAGRRTRRNRQAQRPPDEVVSFAEYERLYRHSWGDPEIRWLMSTVPTAMIFDDHDIRDDWNTSESWRVEVNAKPWWRDRIQAGLASYWVYQHLGNLSPAELADNEDYERLLSTDGDTWPFLDDLADRADYEVDCQQGRAIQLSVGPRTQPADHGRLAQRTNPGFRAADDDRRPRVRVAGRQGRPSASRRSTI